MDNHNLGAYPCSNWSTRLTHPHSSQQCPRCMDISTPSEGLHSRHTSSTSSSPHHFLSIHQQSSWQAQQRNSQQQIRHNCGFRAGLLGSDLRDCMLEQSLSTPRRAYANHDYMMSSTEQIASHKDQHLSSPARSTRAQATITSAGLTPSHKLAFPSLPSSRTSDANPKCGRMSLPLQRSPQDASPCGEQGNTSRSRLVHSRTLSSIARIQPEQILVPGRVEEPPPLAKNFVSDDFDDETDVELDIDDDDLFNAVIPLDYKSKGTVSRTHHPRSLAHDFEDDSEDLEDGIALFGGRIEEQYWRLKDMKDTIDDSL